MSKPSEKGQALTELAIFGSILLFCVGMLLQYGLQANYQQQVGMEAFRKAQKIAFYKGGPNSSASVVLIKDKPLPDPRDQFGFAERSSIASGANAVWSTTLSYSYVTRFNDKVKAKDLPAVYFDVEADKADNLTEAKVDLSKARPARQQEDEPVPAAANENNVLGFYTARVEQQYFPPNIVVPNPYNPDLPYISIPSSNIQVMRIEPSPTEENNLQTEAYKNFNLLMYPYYLDDDKPGEFRFKHRITQADVVGWDGKLENIIGANYINNDKVMLYVVSHDAAQIAPNTTARRVRAGQIEMDTENFEVRPWDKKGLARPDDKQGLIQDFNKTIQHRGSRIVKTQEKGVINSSTTLDATQTITHKLRLNDGRVLEIPAQFTVDKKELYNKW